MSTDTKKAHTIPDKVKLETQDGDIWTSGTNAIKSSVLEMLIKKDPGTSIFLDYPRQTVSNMLNYMSGGLEIRTQAMYESLQHIADYLLVALKMTILDITELSDVAYKDYTLNNEWKLVTDYPAAHNIFYNGIKYLVLEYGLNKNKEYDIGCESHTIDGKSYSAYYIKSSIWVCDYDSQRAVNVINSSSATERAKKSRSLEI